MNLFGCVGLRNKKFCIFNTQYTQKEYEALVPKIIEHMQRTGEWGQFFPMKQSSFAYNETEAQEYFPLQKDEVEQRNLVWQEETEAPQADKVISASQIPDSLNDIPDDILYWAVQCDVTNKPFRIIKQELDYYRRSRLPLPRLHPDERHARRLALRNPQRLWKRACAKCAKAIETSYSPDRPEIVYCEECYLQEVY